MVQSAISQVQINQVLVGHANVGGKRLEVSYSILVQPNGNRLFKFGDIGVAFALHLRKIIVSSHSFTSGNLLIHVCRLFVLK